MATDTPLFPSILLLPYELSDQIFRELETVDLQQMRLACRAFSKSRSIQEKLFRTLHIHLYTFKIQTHALSLLSFCAAVKSGKTDVASFVRCLEIKGEHCQGREVRRVIARAKRIIKVLFSVQRRLVKALIEILPHLKGVTILQLSFVSQPNMINKPLMDSLSSMSSISQVTMLKNPNPYRIDLEPRFPSGFRDLERFTIPAVLNTAELESLFQHSGRTLTHLACMGVDELQLADVPQLGRGLPLRSICIDYDFPESVWKAFSGAGIRLEHVSVYQFSRRAGVLEYLGSYSGLRSLLIYVTVASEWTPTFEGLQNFFAHTLARHEESITSIDIVPATFTSWSCNAEALLALKVCTQLSLLRITLDPYQSPNPIAICLDLLPSWHRLSELEFYCRLGPPWQAVVDSVIAFRSHQLYTNAMTTLNFRCHIWKFTLRVFEDGSYGFSAFVCQKGNPHNGKQYRGSDQYVRDVWSARVTQ